jgi:hypothetical protein
VRRANYSPLEDGRYLVEQQGSGKPYIMTANEARESETLKSFWPDRPCFVMESGFVAVFERVDNRRDRRMEPTKIAITSSDL